MRIVVGIAFAGFLGAISRYGVGFLFPRADSGDFPWATLFINLSGSLLLGALAGLLIRRRAPVWFGEVAGTGFLGAFTTFSAFNGQLWQMCQQQAYAAASIYALLSMLGGWGLAAAGLAWGRRGAS
ncbi:camphor resistance protein CrcB [Cohnella lupini]|uniref:Fluoride-specific ion channel FluC n=2 Tax=Cohnella lupini TaxID=1294267 RepID=A0A3D9IVY9_9BACL|nr:camphor resistance protein CrcB [Cohnella lupini]